MDAKKKLMSRISQISTLANRVHQTDVKTIDGNGSFFGYNTDRGSISPFRVLQEHARMKNALEEIEGQVSMLPILLDELSPEVKDACEICKGTRGGVPGNENIIAEVTVCDHCSATMHKFDELVKSKINTEK